MRSVFFSALFAGQRDLFPFFPFLEVKRFPAPRLMYAAIMDENDVVPLALFEVKLKSAIIPIGVIHHEEGTELVPLRQTKKVVPDNGTDGIDFSVLSVQVMAQDVIFRLVIEIGIGSLVNGKHSRHEMLFRGIPPNPIW